MKNCDTGKKEYIITARDERGGFAFHSFVVEYYETELKGAMADKNLVPIRGRHSHSNKHIKSRLVR